MADANTGLRHEAEHGESLEEAQGWSVGTSD